MIPDNNTQPINESRIIFLAGMIQFVNMIDFVMVMPLGPDFSHSLGIPNSEIGIIGGVYALAAGLMGLIGSFFLDNYARKRAILIALAGLSVATLGGAMAWDKNSMLAARIAAGLFGGPLGALTLALIADYIPPQHRGTAMGKVMGAFSVASVIGIPAGLELARLISWHAPFIAVSFLGWAAFFFTWRFLPYHKAFTNEVLFKHRLIRMGKLLKTPIVLTSYLLVVVSMAMAFFVIPNFSAHYQLNLDFPRAHLGFLYFFGGIVSFFGMRIVGAWLDKSSATRISIYATALAVIVLLAGFIYFPMGGFGTEIIPIIISVSFMLAMTTRNICTQTLFSKIPPPEYRGAYNSLQNALVHFSQAGAAWVAAKMLVEQDGRLLHVDHVGWLSLGFALAIPVFIYAIEKNLKKVH